ncbi:hypothetical protein FHS42_006973 [Streptomyces zagrosensis]|uniref:Uncharacterized protein n=1 Tax=Streptomyces zagrosensis TaxID=1042984 RepID=A0A7W9QGK3_9ACTN|nr:hypothetical protein [Streptomyces zagrosensis]
MPAVVQLRSEKALTVRSAADVFLGSLANPNTARGYGTGVGKTAERLGEDRPLAAVVATRSVRRWNCCGALRRSTPGTPAEQRCCPGSAGARTTATTARRCRPG